MTFLEVLSLRQPDWQSKDLLVLFYTESDYSLSVKEFVDTYYATDAVERIEGRCGYLRQAFPFVIKDYDFTKISLMVDGINSQLSDIDFYDAVREAIKSTGTIGYDVTLPAYFRQNPFISKLSSTVAPATNRYMYYLEWLLQKIKKSMNWKGAVAPMLDAMKNSFIGRVHYPHPHFMEKGCHAITLQTHAPDVNNENKED